MRAKISVKILLFTRVVEKTYVKPQFRNICANISRRRGREFKKKCSQANRRKHANRATNEIANNVTRTNSTHDNTDRIHLLSKHYQLVNIYFYIFLFLIFFSFLLSYCFTVIEIITYACLSINRESNLIENQVH